MQKIQTSKLFVASCLSLLVTSLSFGIRAGIMGQLGTQFNLDGSELATITATAFWGFPLAVVIGGFIVDIIGMKRLLVLAFIFHLLGIILTIFATGYWTLFFSTLLIGIANGTVEASCNPLVTALYPENKTTRLNYFHLWFPGGIVIGSLLVFLFTKIGLGWQIQVGMMLVPTLIYGYLFSKLDFPPTERVAAGISTADMYKALASPLFVFMLICMFGTAITELFTNQWTDVFFKTVTNNAILILTFIAAIQVLGADSAPAGTTGSIAYFSDIIRIGYVFTYPFTWGCDIFRSCDFRFGGGLLLAVYAGFCIRKFAAHRRLRLKPDGRRRNVCRIVIHDFYGRIL
jgi:MFS family permease